MNFVCTSIIELLIVKTSNSKIQAIRDSSLSVNYFFCHVCHTIYNSDPLFLLTQFSGYTSKIRELWVRKMVAGILKGGEERISTLLRSLFLHLIQMAFL